MSKINKSNIPTLTPEEIDAIHAELYLVNSSHHCANPAWIGWIRGYNETQVRLMGKKRTRKK